MTLPINCIHTPAANMCHCTRVETEQLKKKNPESYESHSLWCATFDKMNSWTKFSKFAPIGVQWTYNWPFLSMKGYDRFSLTSFSFVWFALSAQLQCTSVVFQVLTRRRQKKVYFWHQNKYIFLFFSALFGQFHYENYVVSKLFTHRYAHTFIERDYISDDGMMRSTFIQ